MKRGKRKKTSERREKDIEIRQTGKQNKTKHLLHSLNIVK